ncbi:MAG TPA: peptide-methionine (S)-S-oxide reductase MsrA [Candidatus Eisenbacteria bacterium]|nr:peptide-methionine (S)-S-oxide reductase MsrA [Candidatus Eisenbacteria bacterium]
MGRYSVRVVTIGILLVATAPTLCFTLPATGAPPASPKPSQAAPIEHATFAGGCFWCMEPPFESLPGVRSVTSGYSGGPEKDPTYSQVSSGLTGHTESIDIVFDPKTISYERLLQVYWRNIDPTQRGGQFCDKGSQYRSAIFYRTPQQKTLAERSRDAIVRSGRLKGPIVTEVTNFRAFFAAEEYHQDYYKKNPDHYHAYRKGCGRDERLRAIWGSGKEDE